MAEVGRWKLYTQRPRTGPAACPERPRRYSRVPRMPRLLRQPRHAGGAWYCPFTLASGSDPRHESRVALLALPEERARVDRLAGHEHLVVEVGPRAPAGAPDEPDDLPLRHPLADLHVELLQVAVERPHAVAVIERDVLAEAPVGARLDDRPRRRRLDRRPRRAADVDPLVMLWRPGPRRAAHPVP